MFHADVRRKSSEVVEHDRTWQALQHLAHGDDLLAFDVQLHVPAELGYTLRERLDHVDRHHRSRRIADRESQSANAAFVEALQFGIANVGPQHTYGSRVIRAELRDR